MRGFGLALALSLAVPIIAQAQTAAPPAPAATLPGGANALQESFQDWRLGCVVGAGGHRLCSATQEQADAKSHQRVLAIELRAAGNGNLEGVLLLPFGLLLERGVTLQIDDAAPGAPLKVRTCLPAGCVVPLSFDGKTVAALRKGSMLKAKVVTEDGRDITFTLSLAGLPAALDRLEALTKG